MKTDKEIFEGACKRIELNPLNYQNAIWFAIRNTKVKCVHKEELSRRNLLKLKIIQSAIDKLIRDDVSEDFEKEFAKFLEDEAV